MKLDKIISKEELTVRSAELAKEIEKKVGEGENLLILGVLKGAFVFTADLVRNFSFDVEVDFIRAKSYLGKESTGVVEILYEPSTDFENKVIVLVEDIIDSGKTLEVLKEYLLDKGAKKVLICSMIDRKIEGKKVKPDFVGFEISDKRFLVGYGLDVDEHFRVLADVYAIDDHG